MGDAFSVLLGIGIVLFLFWLWKERQDGEDSMLNEFFRAHQFVGNEMAKLRDQEEATKA